MLAPTFSYVGSERVYADYNIPYSSAEVGQPGFSRIDFNCLLLFPAADSFLNVDVFGGQTYKALCLEARTRVFITYSDPFDQSYFPQDLVDISSPSGAWPLQVGAVTFSEQIVFGYGKLDLDMSMLQSARVAEIVAAQIGRGSLPQQPIVDTGTTTVFVYLNLRIIGFKSESIGRVS